MTSPTFNAADQPVMIRLAEHLGPFVITPDDGWRIYRILQPLLEAGHRVVLDFEHVEICATPFLNIAIGQLLHNRTDTRLHELLTFKDLPAAAAAVLEIVLQNAKEYYTDPVARAALDAVLRNLGSNEEGALEP